MTSPSELADYYERKGYRQRGDEPTEQFSDDEGATDNQVVRRTRRSAVQIIRSATEEIKGHVSADEELRRGSIVAAGRPNARGQVSIDVVDVPKTNADTFVRVRNMGREFETQLTQENISYVDSRVSTPTVAPGHRITFNATKLLERVQDADKYPRDMAIVACCAVGFFIVVYFIYSTFGPYLPF